MLQKDQNVFWQRNKKGLGGDAPVLAPSAQHAPATKLKGHMVKQRQKASEAIWDRIYGGHRADFSKLSGKNGLRAPGPAGGRAGGGRAAGISGGHFRMRAIQAGTRSVRAATWPALTLPF